MVLVKITFNLYRNCLRRCRPYFDNDPPIIMAFGPPDPRDTLKNGHIFTTNGKLPMQNGHSAKHIEQKMNGNGTPPIIYPMPTNEHNGHSPSAYRRELVNEFNKDSKKPNYLRYLFVSSSVLILRFSIFNLASNAPPEPLI